MNKRIAVLSLLGGMLFAFATQAVGIDVLFPGGTIEEDLPLYARGGKLSQIDFMALYEDFGRYYLTKTRVSYSSDEIKSTFSKPVIFIHNSSLKPGEINVAKVSWDDPSTIPWVSEKKMKIVLQGHEYYIYKNKDVFVLAKDNGVKSYLYPGFESIGIIWAGDLDRDGELDLIITSDSENSAQKCLLLSSIAEKPDLIKEAACQFFSG